MEAVGAYYNGHAFVPTQPIKVQKNQKAIVTILDEVQSQTPRERAIRAIEEMQGMFKGTGLSSEDYMARKAYEKSLEL
ncbi:hypothetical protein AGMMS50256_04070 [Betaproteobacteria bacterium]|nr:hypothetical protein AGMMS50256_04070 [Betaproteobacteria bacterium]